jgi:hypothetical protein
MRSRGFSPGLAEWMGSNLKRLPGRRDESELVFNPAGAQEMYDSYRWERARVRIVVGFSKKQNKNSSVVKSLLHVSSSLCANPVRCFTLSGRRCLCAAMCAVR